MNTKLWIGGLLSISLCGCSTMNNTQAGAATGGVLGAGIGALAARHNPLVGAAIGGGAGALLGGAVGSHEDRAEKRHADAVQAAQQQYAATHPQLSLTDIVQMSQLHHSDTIIINQIRTTNSYFSINAADVTYLREQGVSEGVIVEMQNRRGPGPVYVNQPRGVVVVEPPPPPVGVGVGVVYGRRW